MKIGAPTAPFLFAQTSYNKSTSNFAEGKEDNAANTIILTREVQELADLAADDFDHDVAQEQIEAINLYLERCLIEICRENQASHSRQMAYYGKSGEHDLVQKNCMTVYYADDSTCRVVTIFFQECSDVEIRNVFKDLYDIGSEVIDFAVLSETGDIARIASSKCTYMDH